MSKAPSQISFLINTIALVAAIGGPFLYIGAIKTDLALAKSDIIEHTRRLTSLESKQEYMRRLLEDVALKQGINIDKVRQEISALTTTETTP